MNFFFHAAKTGLTSYLTIPKFSNLGDRDAGLSLFSASIVSGNWQVKLADSREDDNFWYVERRVDDEPEIYFLATESESQKILSSNKLMNLNSFTDTTPDYRANLLVRNEQGGFSSYQGEYPYRMTTKLSSFYSDCGTLTTANCKSVGFFVVNIYQDPIVEDRNIILFDQNKDKQLDSFTVTLNRTSYIDLTKYKDDLKGCYLYADDYMGIPIYLIEYEDGNLSFEHTHPPHESVGGVDRFKLINKFKESARAKIYS